MIWRRRCGGLSVDDVEHDDLEDLAEAIRRSRDRDDDLAEALRRSREDAAPRDPDAELAEALRRSREDARPRVGTWSRRTATTRSSSTTARRTTRRSSSTRCQEEVEPARPSAEEVRAARLARLG